MKRVATFDTDVRPVLLVDKKQPDPHPWQQFLSLPIVRGRVAPGNVSLPGCQAQVSLHRMTGAELFAGLTWARDPFVDLLKRAARVPAFWVVIEGSYEDLLGHKLVNKEWPWRTAISLQQRFKIPFLFANSPKIAAYLGEGLLKEWLSEHRRALAAFDRAMQKIEAGGGL